MGEDHNKLEPGAGMDMTARATPQTELVNGLPWSMKWEQDSVPALWLNKVETMLLHSASMTGAAVPSARDLDQLIHAMCPLLMQIIPYERLDAVYARALTKMLMDPESRAVMINAHDFLAMWSLMQSEQAAEQARNNEAAARRYRAEAEAALRANPRKVRHISEYARRDGVDVPWDTGAGKQPARETPRTEQDSAEAARLREAAEVQERLAIREHNREIWYKLNAMHEAQQDGASDSGPVDGTEGEDDDALDG